MKSIQEDPREKAVIAEADGTGVVQVAGRGGRLFHPVQEGA
jgi:hypothetical protein